MNHLLSDINKTYPYIAFHHTHTQANTHMHLHTHTLTLTLMHTLQHALASAYSETNEPLISRSLDLHLVT